MHRPTVHAVPLPRCQCKAGSLQQSQWKALQVLQVLQTLKLLTSPWTCGCMQVLTAGMRHCVARTPAGESKPRVPPLTQSCDSVVDSTGDYAAYQVSLVTHQPPVCIHSSKPKSLWRQWQQACCIQLHPATHILPQESSYHHVTAIQLVCIPPAVQDMADHHDVGASSVTPHAQCSHLSSGRASLKLV